MRPRLPVLLLVVVAGLGLLSTSLLLWDGGDGDDPTGPDVASEPSHADPDAPPPDPDHEPPVEFERDRDGGGGDPAREPEPAGPATDHGDPDGTTVGGSSPDPTTTTVSEGLADRLADLASSTTLDEHRVGLVVLSADGAPVLEREADLPLMPASTQKLVTAAAALSSLGPDFRYVTTVAATAEPDDDGVLDGDLVVVGSGDPTLATPTYSTAIYPARPATPLSRLADALVDAGLTRVTGNVVGDSTAFADEPRAEGWLTDYFHSLDATHVSALTVDGGRRIFERDGRLLAEAASHPAGVAAGALRDLLEDAGVPVDGTAGTTRRPPDADHELTRVTSPPLERLLPFMVQRSDNHLADAIHRTVGSRVMGVGSWTGAAAGTLSVLDELGVDWTGAVIADGSGLSRDDRLTARQLATLDVAMTSEFGEQWEDLMATAGVSGTLEGRLRGTYAEGRMRGKTGTLRDVRSLSGAVTGSEGDRYHFAVIGNDLDGVGIQAVRALTDELVVALAEDVEGCRRVATGDGDDDEVATAESYELVCPG